MTMISSRGRGTNFSKMFEDSFGLRSGHDRRQGRYVGLLYSLQAAEMLQQAAGSGFAYAGNFPQLGGSVADLAALAMEGYGEAMGFVADLLYQM